MSLQILSGNRNDVSEVSKCLQLRRSKTDSIKSLAIERNLTIAVLDHRAQFPKLHCIELFARSRFVARKLFAVGLEFPSEFPTGRNPPVNSPQLCLHRHRAAVVNLA